MYPDLFKIPGLNFTVHSYGVMLLIAFFVGVWWARKRAPRFGVSPAKVYDAAFWALIFGVLGARVFFIAQEWPHFAANHSELFSWQFQGLTSFGGVVFGVISLFVWSRLAKVSFIRILDVLSAPFLVAHAIGRVGCLLNGCCYGGKCDLPWAIHVANEKGLFHPAQIYDSLMNLAGVFVLLAIERRGLPYGRSVSIMLILHGTARFIYEFWRAGTTSTYLGKLPITDAQGAALLLALIGTIGLITLPHYGTATKKVAAVEA
jgi:phosphatidylglycerol:prolipoprotein diacylglycerol transferase